MSEDETTAQDPYERIVEEWQKRLLQLDRRNQLLNFTPGKSAVRIIDQTLNSLVETLLSLRPGTGLTFDYAEPRPRNTSADTSADLPDYEYGDDSDAYVVEGDLSVGHRPLELQGRLRNLQRRDRHFKEEQGLNVLYLAFGFLQWTDEEGNDFNAPLLLLPCDLKRASSRDPFTLYQEDDQLTTNTTLGVKLAEMPKLGEGSSVNELDPNKIDEYLKEVGKLAETRPGWTLNNEIYLGIFSYSKIAMYQDLETLKKEKPDHPVISAFMRGSGPQQGGTPIHDNPSILTDLAGAKLDDLLPVKDQFAILPADYSQLLAIKSAREKNNLVIHGPPGTGKSQTIANLIATFMADGKSVLFVSEKTAALDVVKRRLDANQLGVFCLDLHSDRGKKTNVYRQLQESLNLSRTVSMAEFDYNALDEKRKKLNRVVRALHQVREPLGRTIFQVHARLASLEHVPRILFDVKDVDSFTQEYINQVRDAANRIRLREREFREHWTSHWRILRLETRSLELANTIRQNMQVISEAMVTLQTVVPNFAQDLGFPIPKTFHDIGRLQAAAMQLATAPGVPLHWLQEGIPSRLHSIAARERDLQQTRANLLEQLETIFGKAFSQRDYAAILKNTEMTPEEEKGLHRLFGSDWEQKLIQRQQLSLTLKGLRSTVAQLHSTATEVSAFLQMNPSDKWVDIVHQLGIVQKLSALGSVPASWTWVRGSEAVVTAVQDASKLAEDLAEKEYQLFSEFEPDVIDVVDQSTLVRYRTTHQSWVHRLFGSSYRSDRQAIRAFRRGGETTSLLDELTAVEKIVEFQRTRASWQEVSTRLTPLLEHRFIGRSTNWETVLRDVDDAVAVVDARPGNRQHFVELLTGGDSAGQSRELARTLETICVSIEDLMRAGLDIHVAEQVKGGSITLTSLTDLILDADSTLERMEEALAEPLENSRGQILNLEQLKGLMEAGVRLKSLEQEHLPRENALQTDFRERFKGFETDWSDIIACLVWSGEFLDIVGRAISSPGLLAHAEKPAESSFYQGVIDASEGSVQGVETKIKPVMRNYDISKGPWESWEQAKFEEIKDWSQKLLQDADSAGDWLHYKSISAELDEMLGMGTSDLIRESTEECESVPDIIERRILQLWLDLAYLKESALVDFTTAEHEDLLSTFSELDRQSMVAAQREVKRKVLGRYPNEYSSNLRTGELADLRGQLTKTRGQWTVRRLLRSIPHLIQTLKPCFFMSPLAVSQYLPQSEVASETLSFDVVIFDEASQVFPEDAIPAIRRAKQSILAGDRKQLPPTSFWRRTIDDDEPDDTDDEQDNGETNRLLGQQSILDAGVAAIGRTFSEEHLKTHYRSVNPNLIKFSNRHFYTPPGLLLFPSPGLQDPWTGVQDVYVPDGRYEPREHKYNRIEAERVVDLVFEHMRTRPLGETLGVVAFSKSQADLIDRMVERRRISERDVEEKFDERPDEPFFVKNLENVQGDERDRIILSVGYGPTVGSGAVHNRFGPINNEGGERRLNVVISRARKRLDVVHSLRHVDITASSVGARLLKRFLEYVADPERAFESEVTVDPAAETESPFEEAVEQALISRGYKTERQIGVSGYRIDLAILSEDGKYRDLGIECDGWTYHNSATARDRDWQRLSVLKGLGWKMHRVWSTAWVSNPEAEIARIEKALSEARAAQTVESSVEPERQEPMEKLDVSDDSQEETITSELSEIFLETWEEAQLPEPGQQAGLGHAKLDQLATMVHSIVAVEGPVHHDVIIDRIKRRYESSSVKGSTRSRLEGVIGKAVEDELVSSIAFADAIFYWLTCDQLGRKPRNPVDRDISHYPPHELRQVVIRTSKLMFGAERRDLIKESARILGFKHLGPRIQEVFNRTIEGLLDSGELGASFGKIHSN